MCKIVKVFEGRKPSVKRCIKFEGQKNKESSEENTEKPEVKKISLDPKWEKYACGKTKDQVYMTHNAHLMLNRNPTLQPRQLNFYKRQDPIATY
ncbi:hypothetical protein DMENIID0001_090380 [Sergentomyia squamirostris]